MMLGAYAEYIMATMVIYDVVRTRAVDEKLITTK